MYEESEQAELRRKLDDDDRCPDCGDVLDPDGYCGCEVAYRVEVSRDLVEDYGGVLGADGNVYSDADPGL